MTKEAPADISEFWCYLPEVPVFPKGPSSSLPEKNKKQKSWGIVAVCNNKPVLSALKGREAPFPVPFPLSQEAQSRDAGVGGDPSL